jgi:FkbM family methyltransferase
MKRTVVHLEFGKFHIVRPTDVIQRQLLISGTFEPLTMRLVGSLLREGGSFVDVGANIGVFSIAAAKTMGGSGRVLAIEPNPSICAELLENRRLNSLESSIAVVNAAVGNRSRLAAFGVPFKDNQGTCREVDGTFANRFYSYTVPLADVCAELGIDRIKLLKIDVEGAENSVLDGVLDWERLRPEHIVLEYLPEHFDYSSGDGPGMLDRLVEYGYELATVEGDGINSGPIPEGNVWARLKARN